MTSPRTIRLSADDNFVIAIGLVNWEDAVAGLTARERILRTHKMAIGLNQAIAAFLSNGVSALLVMQLFNLRIRRYFERSASHIEDACACCQAFAELMHPILSSRTAILRAPPVQ
jgi:hypothetical protein